VGSQIDGYDADAFHYVLSRILVAARANSLQAIDGPYVSIRDLPGFRKSAAKSAALGYDGKWVVHPSQVAAGNEGGSRPKLGDVAGYGLLNARASWQVTQGWKAYVRINNLLDRRYITYATGNEDAFPRGVVVRPGEDLGSARFVAPGLGRHITVGMRYEWR